MTSRGDPAPGMAALPGVEQLEALGSEEPLAGEVSDHLLAEEELRGVPSAGCPRLSEPRQARIEPTSGRLGPRNRRFTPQSGPGAPPLLS